VTGEESPPPAAGDGAVAPDRIELRGLRVLGTHGVLAEERDRPQPFEVDLDVVADLGPAGASDDLGQTIDYGVLAAQVVKVVGGERCDLLERLAARIAEVVLGEPRVSSVTVAVRKLRPPVPVDLASAGVRVTRTRDGPGG
jgi:dihydroneopterin aldolase